jgi:2-phosphosulfolactate phosphatase
VRLDVFFGYQQLSAAEVTGRIVAVIDVLRASTTIAVALANGAKAVVPFASGEEAAERIKQLDRSDARLAGEQKLQTIPGFDLGNSPAEFTQEAISGKTILLATTNGTAAILAAQGARDIVVASFVNFSAVTAMLRAALRAGADVALICAGQERRFTLEDGGCAGRYARAIGKKVPRLVQNDGAQACCLIDSRYGDDVLRLFHDSSHGKALAEAGFEDDLRVCAQIDSHPVVPVYRDRQITKLGDQER